MTVTIEISPQAAHMLDEADERWTTEHGFNESNPLLDEVARAVDLLRETPELGIVYQRSGFRLDV